MNITSGPWKRQTASYFCFHAPLILCFGFGIKHCCLEIFYHVCTLNRCQYICTRDWICGL